MENNNGNQDEQYILKFTDEQLNYRLIDHFESVRPLDEQDQHSAEIVV